MRIATPLPTRPLARLSQPAPCPPLLGASRSADVLRHALRHVLRRKVIHNISQYPVSDRPGTESYDPVLFGGKSVRLRPFFKPVLPSPLAHLPARRFAHVARPLPPQLVDHYPYAACAFKEVLVNPLKLRGEINACDTGAP